MALPRQKTQHTAPRWWLEDSSFIERMLRTVTPKKASAVYRAAPCAPVRKTA